MSSIFLKFNYFLNHHVDLDYLNEKSWSHWSFRKIENLREFSSCGVIDSLVVHLKTLSLATIALTLDATAHSGKALLNCCRLCPKKAVDEMKNCGKTFLIFLAIFCLTSPSKESPTVKSELEIRLDEWEENSKALGNKREAKKRILFAIKYKKDTLDLSSLELNKLPECITQITHLIEINLSNNKLISIPPNLIGPFTSLWQDDLNNQEGFILRRNNYSS